VQYPAGYCTYLVLKGITMKEILSKDNQWIKMAVALKTKKGRLQHQRLFVEGLRIVADAACCGLTEGVCFVTEEGRRRSGFAEFYEMAGALNWQFYVVPDGVYQKISDTQNPQGIAAMLPFFEYGFSDAMAAAGNRPLLFLQAIQDPGNLGTVLRTAAAANVGAVLLGVNSVDLYNDKTLRSAMGAVFKIPVVRNVTDEAVFNFSSQSGRIILGTTPHGTVSYANADYTRPVVLAFGNEANGLTQSFMDRCDTLITIPMREGMESLNLSMSVGVVVYKAWEMTGFSGT
jgi:TrmH family RNA methyltransferase